MQRQMRGGRKPRHHQGPASQAGAGVTASAAAAPRRRLWPTHSDGETLAPDPWTALLDARPSGNVQHEHARRPECVPSNGKVVRSFLSLESGAEKNLPTATCSMQ